MAEKGDCNRGTALRNVRAVPVFSDPPQTCPVLGFPLAETDYAHASGVVLRWAAARDRVYSVAAANTHVLALGRRQPGFARTLGAFDLLLPDGMPLVWCMNRWCKSRLNDRVYGPTFMLRCIEAAGDRFAHFLLGGTEELLAQLQSRLRERCPAIRFAGAYAPPFGAWSAEENARIIEKIREAKAPLVWIGLGCPKQENWIAQHKAALPPAVYFAVGAAFAFHAGVVRQAPLWVQRRGLEWAFRIAAEPRRLLRRYLLFNSLFLWYLARESFRRRS